MYTVSGAQSPVCAGSFAVNRISLSFFKQTIYRKQLPDALGTNKRQFLRFS